MTRHRFALAAPLAAVLLFAACGSDDLAVQTTATAAVAETDVGADETPTATSDESSAGTSTSSPEPSADTVIEPPPGGDGPPPGGDGPPPGGDNSLATGPTNVGEHGPLSNADFDGDEEVTHEELDTFIDGNPQRDIGLVAFFEDTDTNGDDVIDQDELAVVDPATAFDGTDANDDGQVTLNEAVAYANEEGRTYRAVGLSAFFDLVDTNGDDVADAEEIEAAHVSGLLARG